jgi:hypothetical protein
LLPMMKQKKKKYYLRFNLDPLLVPPNEKRCNAS